MIKALLLMTALITPAMANDEMMARQARFAFFQKVGIIKRAAAVCGDTDLDQASVNILNTKEVQEVENTDNIAKAGIIAGVVAFNERLNETGLQFNCDVVKHLAKQDGYLK